MTCNSYLFIFILIGLLVILAAGFYVMDGNTDESGS